MKNKILLFIFMALSSILVASEKENEPNSLKITTLLPDLQQTIVDYVGYDWKLVLTLKGHENIVNTISISNDGSLLVSGSNDNTIKLWDTNTGNCLRTSNFCFDFEQFPKKSFIDKYICEYADINSIAYIALAHDKNHIAILDTKHRLSLYSIKEDKLLINNLSFENLFTKAIDVHNEKCPERTIYCPCIDLEQFLKGLYFISISPDNKYLLYFNTYIKFVLDLQTLDIIKKMDKKEFDVFKHSYERNSNTFFHNFLKNINIPIWNPTLKVYNRRALSCTSNRVGCRIKSDNPMQGFYSGQLNKYKISFIRDTRVANQEINITNEFEITSMVISSNEKYLSYAAGNDIKIYENMNQRLLE